MKSFSTAICAGASCLVVHCLDQLPRSSDDKAALVPPGQDVGDETPIHLREIRHPLMCDAETGQRQVEIALEAAPTPGSALKLPFPDDLLDAGWL